MIVDHERFLAIARAAQWDEGTIDLGADARAWPTLADEARARITALVAGFRVGEAAVAEHLEPFATVAGPAARTLFALQTGDEERHARFFARVCGEVTGDPGPAPAPFQELFLRRLPAVAGAVGRGEVGLEAGVGLYHMVLEGAVFTAGLLTFQALLADLPLPGLRRGIELVLRDERWHVGFGVRCLIDARVDDAALDRIRAEGERAVDVWGAAVPPELAEHVRRTIRRRLVLVRSEADDAQRRSATT
jgi:ribonucleoside-diphosphate reductase beta chain